MPLEKNQRLLDSDQERLNGWKEISGWLRKSIRTAQRWEGSLGLPIHRIHTPRGEIVYASKEEIDRWQSTMEEVGGQPRVAVSLEWVASLSRSDLRQLLHSGRVRRADWPEAICQACLAMRGPARKAGPVSAERIRNLLEYLATSSDPVVASHARCVLGRLQEFPVT